MSASREPLQLGSLIHPLDATPGILRVTFINSRPSSLSQPLNTLNTISSRAGGHDLPPGSPVASFSPLRPFWRPLVGSRCLRCSRRPDRLVVSWPSAGRRHGDRERVRRSRRFRSRRAATATVVIGDVTLVVMAERDIESTLWRALGYAGFGPGDGRWERPRRQVTRHNPRRFVRLSGWEEIPEGGHHETASSVEGTVGAVSLGE